MPRALIACKQSILPEITMGAVDGREENLFFGIISCSQWFILWTLYGPVKQFSKSRCKKNYLCYTELTDGYVFLRNVSDKNMLSCETCWRKPLSETCSICLFAHFYISLSKVYTFQNCLKFYQCPILVHLLINDATWLRVSPQALYPFLMGWIFWRRSCQVFCKMLQTRFLMLLT